MAINNTTAVVNAPSRGIFAPMFSARWQSMQNIVNDSVYINMIPAGYKTYYTAFIQQWLCWSRGFVPQLHKSDFFSTGMGYTVCDIMTKECLSGGFRIHSNDADTKDFFGEWRKDDLNNILNRMFFYSNAGGNAMLVLTPVHGELYPAVYPIDRVVFQIGRNNKISSIMILNRFVAGDAVYYTREHRWLVDGKGYWRVQLAKGDIATAPSWAGGGLGRVPDDVLTQWEYCYGDIMPGKTYEMPEKMRGIGCYNVRNKSVAVALADLPGYSDSTLHTCLDVLYSIDYNYTQGQVDQYLGKSRVLVPKEMGAVKIMNQPGTLADGKTFREAVDYYKQPLNDIWYAQVPSGNSIDGDTMKPTFVQPDLRGEAHKFIRDSDLELLASKVGLSASTLASHLASGGGTKTDDEISAEGSATEKTVGNKRKLAQTAINAMLCDVAHFYGFGGDAEIQWGRTTSNSARENAELLADYNAGTLPLREYLRKRWTDMQEDDIERMAAEIEAEKEKERQQELAAAQVPYSFEA